MGWFCNDSRDVETKQGSFSPVGLAHWRTTLVSYIRMNHIKCGKDLLDSPAQLAAQGEGTAVSSFSGMMLHVFSKELDRYAFLI